MNIHVDEIKSYVFVALAMCGEIDKKVLLNSIGSPTYGRRAIMSLRDESGLITEKVIGGQTVLRLKKPAAWKILECVPELKKHYEATTNNHQFKTSPAAAVLRDVRKGELILYALTNNLEVNLLKIDYQNQRGRKKSSPTFLENLCSSSSLTKEESKKTAAIENVKKHIFINTENASIEPLKTYQEIVNYMLPNDVYFFLSQEVKRYKDKDNKNSPTLSINTSRSFGHIIGRENSYAVYLVNEGLIKLNQEIETRYRDYLENIYRKVYGTIAAGDRRNNTGTGACILFCPDLENLKNHIRYPEVKYKNTELSTTVCDIYSNCYAIPLDDKNAIQKIIDFNWKEELLQQIYTDEEISAAQQTLKGYCDAIVNDTMAIELVSMDIKKIETTLNLLHKSTEVEIIISCEESQVQTIRQIYSTYEKQIKIETVEVI